MTDLHERMQLATPDERQRLACAFVRMIVAYNKLLDKGGRWQGGFRVDEWAALAMCYPWQRKPNNPRVCYHPDW